MKKYLLGLLTGLIITSITAYAAYVYTANDIGYQPTDTEWNVNNVAQAINDIKTDINNINNLVDQGDMLYPIGTNIIGLVSDDTPYKDSNDKYILADSTTGKNMIDNVTYKAISSTGTLKGKVGADSVSEFKSGISSEDIIEVTKSISGSTWATYTFDFSSDFDYLFGAVKIWGTGGTNVWGVYTGNVVTVDHEARTVSTHIRFDTGLTKASCTAVGIRKGAL